MNAPQYLEALMLICFGLAWPLANLHMWHKATWRRRVRRSKPFSLG